MTLSRRNFIKTGTLAAAAFGARGSLITDLRLPFSAYYPDDDAAEIKKLASAALDAAKAGGATYADVRLTRIRGVKVAMNKMDVRPPNHVNMIHVGVRVLVDNVWGFASYSTRNVDEVAQLAKNACAQAKINTWTGRPPVELAPAPVATGTWIMPVQRDPLDVPIDEIIADETAAHEVANKYASKLTSFSSNFEFYRQDKTFANSEGSYVTQRLYDSLGGNSIGLVMTAAAGDDTDQVYRTAPFIWPHSAGYEIVKAANYPAVMQKMIDEAFALSSAPPVEVGQYDLILDGEAMGGVVGATFGDHTQIDRALGYEANSGGTSWVAPPADVLGKLKWGTPEVTVKCNRNYPMSPMNTKWDDEGVEPEEFTIVDKGIFVDYQTTREQASWMKDYYKATGRTVKSHGCSLAGHAGNIQMQRQPNVFLQPATKDTKLDDLYSGVEKGIVFLGGFSWADHQGLTGQGGMSAMAYEIRKGKKGKLVRDASFYFIAQEIYKKVTGVGGQSTFEFKPGVSFKGEPMQILSTGNGAPAVRFKDQKITTLSRRA